MSNFRQIEGFEHFHSGFLLLREFSNKAAAKTLTLSPAQRDCVSSLVVNRVRFLKQQQKGLETLSSYLSSSLDRDKDLTNLQAQLSDFGLDTDTSVASSKRDLDSTLTDVVVVVKKLRKRSSKADSTVKSAKSNDDTLISPWLFSEDFKDHMTGDINMKDAGAPKYEAIFKELRSNYNDPMRSKRLKPRDMHDIERLINIHTHLLKDKKDASEWPEFFNLEVLKMFYVLEYGWKLARLYLKNQRATDFNLPFIPALPSSVARTSAPVKPYAARKRRKGVPGKAKVKRAGGSFKKK